MNKGKLTGAVLATAVALAFIGNGVQAADSSSADSAPAQVKCVGGNACKGQSSCQSASNSCSGQNSCKGKGFVMSPSAAACVAAGGKPDTGTKKD